MIRSTTRRHHHSGAHEKILFSSSPILHLWRHDHPAACILLPLDDPGLKRTDGATLTTTMFRFIEFSSFSCLPEKKSSSKQHLFHFRFNPEACKENVFTSKHRFSLSSTNIRLNWFPIDQEAYIWWGSKIDENLFKNYSSGTDSYDDPRSFHLISFWFLCNPFIHCFAHWFCRNP